MLKILYQNGQTHQLRKGKTPIEISQLVYVLVMIESRKVKSRNMMGGRGSFVDVHLIGNGECGVVLHCRDSVTLFVFSSSESS